MYDYLWLFIAMAFHLTKVPQIWMSIMVKAFLLLEVDFARSSFKNTINRDKGEPHWACVCVCAQITDFQLFSKVSQTQRYQVLKLFIEFNI